jgi:hypothetical protein
MVNSNDIAAGFAGIVFGISNTFGTIPGLSLIKLHTYNELLNTIA